MNYYIIIILYIVSYRMIKIFTNVKTCYFVTFFINYVSIIKLSKLSLLLCCYFGVTHCYQIHNDNRKIV